MIVIEGRLFLKGELRSGCVGIEDGRICAIKKVLKGDEHHDFGDDLILPGCIDVHVHFREPGKTYKEDFHSGTLAAAFGGVTCVMDMPNNDPPITTLPSFKEKLALIERKANVDFGLYAKLTKDCELDRLSNVASAFKLFMSETTDSARERMDEDEMKALVRDARGKLPVSIHAEDPRVFGMSPETNLEALALNRPAKAEAEAIDIVAWFGLEKKIHIAHVSSTEGVQAIRRAGHNITSEVTYHHMFLNIEKNSKMGAFGKVYPSLRRKRDNEALKEAFLDETIDILASDHAPHTVGDKSKEFESAPAGIPGVETNIPLMLMQLKENFLSLRRFVDATSSKPANIFSLNKGEIRVDSDGDLIAVDLKNVSKIKADRLHSKCAWTPYEGMQCIFPRAVFLGGQLMVEDGNLVDEPNGRFVRPQTSM